ncbi:PD40 domain-containing protein [Nostoc sp. CENA67]|uniref:PD40 domain-containing protein n=1 Tax=Amazonocrinis nigriterrae CENA67 TaxID=2794033 RepID=A0A8J7HVR7_9NOST|nr:PD40 domain-containing protein [Amazonocrinis nigriterrae]MBH8563249.1 PD40 domain-containing protein [Amazonocrinis nigriterrae CENA67]
MSNQHEPENLTPNNERSLQTLVRTITLSQGEFSLILLRCNYADLRQRIAEISHQISPVHIREINLPTLVKTLYTNIRDQLGEEQPPALMVFGLESVKNIDPVLTSANQVREEFRKNFPFPILLWVNDSVLQKFIRVAADLENWATIIEFEKPTDELVKFLQQKTDEIFTNDETPNPQICQELETARQDLQSREEVLEPALQASLEFVLGWNDYLHDKIDTALEHYQISLAFWQQSNFLERQGILLVNIALVAHRQAEKNQAENQRYWQESKSYLQQAIDIFEQAQRSDLVAKHITKLGEVLQRLQAWTELQSLIDKSLPLHQNYGTPLQLAQDYGFMAEVALELSRWHEAYQLAEQALQILAEIPNLQSYQFAFYRFILAKAQQGLGEVQAAIINLEAAKNASNDQYNPQLYISILERLRLVYFEQGEYLKAFKIKQEQRKIEQQYGFRAFVGASYLNPQRQVISSAQLQAENPESIAEEIAASGRGQDVKRLRERIGGTEHKLTVIHGQSGVGKSSILQGGLIPALQQQAIGERDALPILLRVYTDWVGMLAQSFTKAFEEVRGNQLAVNLDASAAILEADFSQGLENPSPNLSPTRREALIAPPSLEGKGAGGLGLALTFPHDAKSQILEELQKNADRNLLTVLIFDQFEEFFFVYPDQGQRRVFYDFLRVCLDIPFLKIVLSLREDYLHYLLELHRLFDLSVINNNILDKNIRYYLGNFSPADAKAVVQSLTARSQFHLEPALIEQLVQDLAGDLGEVRPIELQIVGTQLQTDKITTLEKYRQFGTKEKLVERFLEEVIHDCGAENEQVARLVLYLLTDENGTRPLKTRAELAADLVAEVEKLDLVLEIFVASRLVLQLPESPADRYQLVHDYLVSFIRQQQGNEILAELTREREQRLQAEEKLKREQDARQILINAQQEADRQIRQGRMQLTVSSGLAVCLLLLAGISSLYALSQIQVAKDAGNKKQEAENKFTTAEANYNLVTQRLQTTQEQQAEIQKKAQELEAKKKDAEQKFQTAQKNQQAAEAESKLAKQKTQQANQNLLAAKADLERVKQKASELQEKNAQAEERIKTAREKVKTAEVKLLQATTKQQQAESQVQQAQTTLNQAQAKLAQAQKATAAAEVAQKEAQKGTELERAGVNALRQFEYAELESLVAAVQSGKELKTLVKDGRPLEKYPAISPIYALDTILNKIKERNQFQGHQGKVYSVSFSHDGKTIATASLDGTARLWNLQGQLLQRFQGHQGGVYGVSFSPDGKTIATASDDKTARFWNLQGQLLQRFQGHQGPVNSVSFSPDGKTIATASDDKTGRLWNLQGQLLQQFQGHQGPVNSVSFSPDGKTIATASSDNTARLWNLQGQLLQQFQGHQGPVNSVSFSPDGKTIATASSDNTARLWNLQGQLLQEFQGHQGRVWGVSFSPDGKTIATASDDNTARLWNLQGQMLQQFQGHQGWVYSVSFSPDGKTIATASDDNTARLWNLQGQLLQQFQGHQGPVNSVSFSPDGKTIATASSDNTAQLWNLQGQLLQRFQGHQGPVNSVSFSPDGKTIATASSDNTARLWNLQGQLLQEFKGHQGPVNSVSFSPDGKTIATASSDNTARLWNLQGQLLQEFKGHQGWVYSVSFSPDGKTIATASSDNTARLWNLQGQLLQEFKGHQGWIYSVSFSPDGKTIATASDDKTARLWNLQGQLLQVFKGHQGTVWGASFSPDGKTIATASYDNTARLWPVENLDSLLVRGCNWLHDYLQNNPNVSESDRRLCDDILTDD